MRPRVRALGRTHAGATLLALCIATLLPASMPAAAQNDQQAQPRGRTPAVVSAALARAGIPESAVGLVVQDLDGSEPVVSLNADSAMNPASTMKLLTTFAGLELLGPSFTWRTEMVTQAPQRGDVLEGDLVIRGSGDPRLTQEAFWLMLRTLRAPFNALPMAAASPYHRSVASSAMRLPTKRQRCALHGQSRWKSATKRPITTVSACSAVGNAPRLQGCTSQTSRPATLAACGNVQPRSSGGSDSRHGSEVGAQSSLVPDPDRDASGGWRAMRSSAS